MRYTPSILTSTYSAISSLNSNFADIQALMELCVFRDGSQDNELLANLDANHFTINNLAAPSNPNDPVRLTDLQSSMPALSGSSLATFATSAGAGLVGFQRSGTGAVTRTISAVLKDMPQSVLDFGALGNGVQDDAPYIILALATGKPLYFPAGTYKIGSTVTISGTGKQIYADGRAVFSASTTATPFILTGTRHYVELGEISAPLAPYCITYHDLQYSDVTIRVVGSCTTACIYHDATAQTIDEGNNNWYLHEVQAGSVPVGVKIGSHATHTLEGETWNAVVIFSATTASFVIGTAGNNTARFNEYNIRPDAQGITPMLVDVYCDANDINLVNWAGMVSPAIAHVRFNTGTKDNHLFAAPGVQASPVILDAGLNTYSVPGVDGERIEGGARRFRGNVVFQPGASVTPGTNGDMVFELTSNTTLKIKVKGSDGTVRSTSLTLA